ncbi:potassium channel protein [Litchfieldia salsa]|uniref:Voltage-gated potassium channel n=1 Tax=Litchfieldia salsa TaxID=930152 RepID=A0A1H0PAA0_9BACI|nr:potassium channel family protein [Litchfieldia salsa]SDP01618.1 voltage-gated potassium channel [Litchfieldia salsa]
MFSLHRILLKLVHLNNWILFWSSTTLLLVSTIMMVALEPETFPTLFDSFWWVMTTVTTVGYGDYYPVTITGRIYAIFLYIFGIGLIGVVIGKIIDSFGVLRKMREEGKLDYKGKNHIVIIGWSKKAEYAVEEILQTDPSMEIVLIDLLEKTPCANNRVFYVKGSATNHIILEKANIIGSRAVIIFADHKIEDSLLADGKTLLIATAVERLAKNAHTTVEVLHEEHIENFVHVHVDEFVVTHETVSRMAVRSAFTKGVSYVYSQLMSHKYGDDLYQITPRPDWKTYRDAFNALILEGATLIANREGINISRRLDDPIERDMELYIICDKTSYEKISNT